MLRMGEQRETGKRGVTGETKPRDGGDWKRGEQRRPTTPARTPSPWAAWASHGPHSPL